MNKLNLQDWLVEEELPQIQNQNQLPQDQSQTQQPNQEVEEEPQSQGEEPQEEPQDITNDPESPDMPEEKEEFNDFESWKKKYFKESISGDVLELIDLLNMVRDSEGLHPYQIKFIEDNYNTQLLRQNSNILQASKEIRNNLKNSIDKNNPATSVVNYMFEALGKIPMLNDIFIKLNGYKGLKGDLYRKYVCALLGAVQVGDGGGETDDIIFNDKEYSISISTRINSRWGDVMLGNWSLTEGDAERYLTDPELKRLQEGSPEEKDVLRRRVVIESIANLFEKRSFIISVAGEDGTVYLLGWDIASSLKSAYTDGKILVKTKSSDNSEAMIDDNGRIIPFLDLKINYTKETGHQTTDGKPETKEFQFIERRNGMLFLTADMNIVRECATTMQGVNFKEIPYRGNPSDLKVLMRCVYTPYDLLLKNC